MALSIGKPLPRLGARLPGPRKIKSSKSRQVKFATPRTANYEKIKQEFLAAVSELSYDKRRQIPAAGTLPEQMVAFGLVLASLPFQCQTAEAGGRLRLGGALVDMKVWLGSEIVIVRVQGDYWHSMPDRKYKDIAQFERLHRLGYRVADLWEKDIYLAWIERRLRSFVENAVMHAA